MFKILKHKKIDILSQIRNYSIFLGAKTGDFFQKKPYLGNQYDQDPFLKEILKNSIPNNVRFL
jgi:hypothetical protein